MSSDKKRGVSITLRRICMFLLLAALMALIGCGRSDEAPAGAATPGEQPGSADAAAADGPETQEERGIEVLKEQYPEYFELSAFKGVEVYVWETADGTYRCGLMSGTNRNKTGAEIQALEQRSLSVAEAKMVLEEIGVKEGYILVIPIPQPYPDSDDTDISKPYIIDEEHAEQMTSLFAHK